jgi:hypothetical protein
VYALQVMDVMDLEQEQQDSSQSVSSSSSSPDSDFWRKVHPAQIPFNLFGNQEDYNSHRRKQEMFQKSSQMVHKGQECLIKSSSSLSGEDSSSTTINGLMPGALGRLQLGPCTSAKAWTWRVSEEGVLKQDERLAGHGVSQATSTHGVWGAISSFLWSSQASRYEYLSESSASGSDSEICLRRGIHLPLGGSSNEAALDTCNEQIVEDEESKNSNMTDADQTAYSSRLVTFSLARYAPASTSPPSTKRGFVPHPPRSTERNKPSASAKKMTAASKANDASSSQGSHKALPVNGSLDSEGATAAHMDNSPVTATTTTSEVIIDSPKIVGSEVVVVQDVRNASRLSNQQRPRAKAIMGSKIQGKGQGTSSVVTAATSAVHVSTSHSTTLQAHPAPVHPLPTLSSLPPGTLSKQTRNLLKDSHPGLFTTGLGSGSGSGSHSQSSKTKIHMDAEERRQLKNAAQTKQVGRTHFKIPRHPYIDASTNLVWKDPATGLEYLTDLCKYLGEDKKTSGRHTLVGVGQYMRTALKIKIYGAALYVSKNDVLSDPDTFGPFAHMTADQLRKAPAFYDHLMNMNSVRVEGVDGADGSGMGFDRTLLIKTNMQLSTETMRSSLKADWRLLSERQKDMLINSSMKPRPAEARMLENIASRENSANCSCGQLAPEEYKVDATCCARGTEVVFTWRKNDDLEVRLDGRLMDIFSEANLAKGIFYEYIRRDDPISPDARNHFVDGFPFLLGPLLAQMKGSMAAHQQAAAEAHDQSATAGTSNSMHFNLNPLIMMSGMASVATKSVSSMASLVQDSAAGTLKASMGATRVVGRKMKDASEDINRRTEAIGDHLTTMALDSADFVAQRTPFMSLELRQRIRDQQLYRHNMGGDGSGGYSSVGGGGPSLRGAAPQLLEYPLQLESSPYFGDEIGISISAEMDMRHWFFSTTVHLYLMLLLIVSLPGTHSTRLVIRSAKNARDERRTRQKAKAARTLVKGDMPATALPSTTATRTIAASLRPQPQAQAKVHPAPSAAPKPPTDAPPPPKAVSVSSKTTLKRSKSRGGLANAALPRRNSQCFTIPEEGQAAEPIPYYAKRTQTNLNLKKAVSSYCL